MYKSHLLEPLITAATTYRLGKADVTTLAATLCQAHEWKVSVFSSRKAEEHHG